MVLSVHLKEKGLIVTGPVWLLLIDRRKAVSLRDGAEFYEETVPMFDLK